MADLSILSMTLIGICAFLIGFTKTSVGGLGIIVVPLIAIAIPGPESTGFILPMLVVADVIAGSTYYRDCEWRIILKIFPITALGVIAGFFVMDWMPREVFNPVLGFIILFMMVVGLIVEKRPFSATGNSLLTWFVGCCAGISTMVANAAGPLMGIYLLQQGLSKTNFVGTRSIFFLLLNVYKLPFSSNLGFVNGVSLKLNLIYLPLILIGALVGAKVLKYINVSLFKFIVRAAACIASIKLITG